MGGTISITELQQGTGVINTQEQNYAGHYQVPNTCPGCGRCRDCGRPYETQPYNPYGLPLPWPRYPNPYIGNWPPGATWISTAEATSQTINSGWASGLQSWN